MAKSFRVKLKKSIISCTKTQKETVRCLGLRRIGHEKVFEDNPAVRGQIFKVQHLLDVTVEK
ncbi:MAG: 50S ribosomal protein L30 [Bdellovibrionales bacterium]